MRQYSENSLIAAGTVFGSFDYPADGAGVSPFFPLTTTSKLSQSHLMQTPFLIKNFFHFVFGPTKRLSRLELSVNSNHKI